MQPRYIHYSSRPEAPSVPPHAINQFSGGTGPLGVYAYQEDAHHTFGADRKYVFILEPSVPVLHTDRYTEAELDADLANIETTIDISRARRMWDKLVARGEARNSTAPFAMLWYVVGHVTRSTDPEDRPGSGQSGCADPALAADLLISLGYEAIDDRKGMMYSSEPEQALFLTDRSFRVVSRSVRDLTPFVHNPPWVGQVLADTLKTVQSTVRPEWLPSLASVKRGKRGAIVSTVKEYGCGVYGCVIPTLDPNVVLKLTTDDTEAQFAADVADTLVAPICVGYHAVLETKVKHARRTVYLLWRDSADKVGGIREEPNGDWAVHYIAKQHAAAQVAFRALHAQGMTADTDRLLVLWAESCEEMARQTQFPDLRALGDGLVEVWGQQSIFFGDIHDGNLGQVDGRWVITDPGNIAVVDRSLVKNPPRAMRRNPGTDVLAAKIQAAARKVATGPGRTSAYIADVWKQLEREGSTGSASYDEFRCELINLFRASEIILEVAKDKRTASAKASALSIGNTVFHTIGVAGAQQAPARRAPATDRGSDARSKRAPAHMTDVEFARVVNEIASDTDPRARMGDRKIFISDIWDVASADPEIGDMGEKEFKRRLVEAHRAQRLILSRADLVSAMDPEHVRRSETVTDGATFHFVNDQKFAPKAPPKPSASVDILPAVLNAVRDMPPSGRFGNDKVFISEVWRVVSEDARIKPMGLPSFKRWLITANRERKLDLARADMPAAMNPHQVKESEIQDLGATFHFIIDRSAGRRGYG